MSSAQTAPAQSKQKPARKQAASGAGGAAQLKASRAAQQGQQQDRGGDKKQAAERGARGSGKPLPHQEKLEQSFGADLSQVRLHTGPEASAACEEQGAEGYALGNAVVTQDENPSEQLIAHEVAHTLQQRQGAGASDAAKASEKHEREADQASDQARSGGKVDQGKLSPAGGGGRIQKQETTSDTGNLEDVLDAVAAQYKWICLKQRDAAADLHKALEKEDPPPLWQTLLIMGAEIALAAALGGVGGLVAGVLVKKLGEKALSLTGKVIVDAVKDASKDFSKKAINGSINALTSKGGDPKEAFFLGQRDTLTDTAAAQEKAFILRKDTVRKSADPMKLAQALLEAISDNLTNAYDLQRQRSLDEWCVYQAKGELGTSKGPKGEDQGTELGQQLGDTSGKGVLGLVIEVNQPGDKPTILRAEVEGLNERTRKELASRAIQDLNIPMTVKGEVGPKLGWAEWFFLDKTQPYLKAGRNEQKTTWVASDWVTKHAWPWLFARAGRGPELWGDLRDPASRQKKLEADKDFAHKGFNLFMNQDLGPLKVGDKIGG